MGNRGKLARAIEHYERQIALQQQVLDALKAAQADMPKPKRERKPKAEKLRPVGADVKVS